MHVSETEVSIKANTELPPCCLRVLQEKYIIVGTYDLNKSTGSRTGSLDIYDENLHLLNTTKTYGAILDLKLSPFDECLLATAHSTGNVLLWKIILEDNIITLEEIANLQVFDTDCLVTSLHFSPLESQTLLVTATTGEIKTIDVGSGQDTFSAQNVADYYSKLDKTTYEVQGSQESAIDQIARDEFCFTHQHSLECWTGEFGQLQPLQNIIFTGGDDATIVAHDLRTREHVWSNNRIHEAGVVGIKCSTPTFRVSKPTSIITGSYDDHIRSLDLRMLNENTLYPGVNLPVVNSYDCNLGGGVWRFSESPQNSMNHSTNDLLVCCMYDGAKILSVDEEAFNVTHYVKKGHDSMCYGGDWCSNFVVTCSFYDKSLQLWNTH